MNLSTTNITFLRDLHSTVKIDMSSGWRHNYFEGLSEISNYIRLIGDDKIYLIIPLFGTSLSQSKPILNLSEPFLINNKSNSDLITKFILEQWNTSGFNINNDTLITFSFK